MFDLYSGALICLHLRIVEMLTRSLEKDRLAAGDRRGRLLPKVIAEDRPIGALVSAISRHPCFAIRVSNDSVYDFAFDVILFQRYVKSSGGRLCKIDSGRTVIVRY